MITSPSNPQVKRLVALRTRRERRRSGSTLVEGREEVIRALGSGARLRGAYVAGDPTGRPLVPAGLLDRLPDPVILGPDAFARAAVRGAAAGVVIEVDDPTVDVSALHLPADPLLLVVEHVEKPGNLGAMLRTADAVGVDAVIVADPATDVTNPNVVRASLGCLFTVPVAVTDTPTAVDALRARSIAVAATLVDAPRSVWDTDLTGPVAVVVGAEHVGLSAAWTTAADRPVRIPMGGAVDSLNAATAAAVVLYEAARQRHHR